jgi:hypothetical protein
LKVKLLARGTKPVSGLPSTVGPGRDVAAVARLDGVNVWVVPESYLVKPRLMMWLAVFHIHILQLQMVFDLTDCCSVLSIPL